MRTPRAAPLSLRLAWAGALLAASVVCTAAHSEPIAFVEAGPEYLGGEYFGAFEPGFSFQSDRFEMRVGLPLRLRLNSAMAAREGVVRSEDWDAWSDAGRALRQFNLELAERRVVLKLGALAHQFSGHGTVVNGLVGSVDPDSMPLGASGRVVLGPLTAEALVSDLFLDGVVGGTVVIEPLSLWGKANDRVHLGASAFADPSAPRSAGSPPAAVYGAGLDLAPLRCEWARLSPYLDANGRGEGFGLHAGVLVDFTLGPAELSLKGEWRRAKAPYAPEYFDVAYSLERLSRAVEAGASLAKADAISGTANTGRGELRLSIGSMVAAASLSGRGAGHWDASLMVEAAAGELDMAAFLVARDFEWGRNPQRFLFQAEARYRISPFVHAWVDVSRLFSVLEQRPTFQAATGLGVAFLAWAE